MENPHGLWPFCILLSAGGNCNMVLVTNIYGDAAQLEETVCKDSQCDQVGLHPYRYQGWVRWLWAI